MTVLSSSPGARNAAILGVGAYRPARIVPNAEIVEAIDSSDEWIQQRSGIKTRRFASADETVQMMSVAASRQAMERAGIEAGADRRRHRGHRLAPAADPGRRHGHRLRAGHEPAGRLRHLRRVCRVLPRRRAGQ